jgi:hypothetical protein
MADVQVALKDGKISVDSNKVQASVSGGHKVKWKSHDGEFHIEFKPGSDWPNPTTSKDGNVWKAEAGPFEQHGRTLSYAVKATGHETLDPDIEILP